MTSPRARVGVMLPRDLPIEQVLPYARRAEALGFDELWVVEDLGFRGGIAQAGVVLAVTERISVGVGILPAGARNAAFSAMELGTLAQLFPGRLIAGIGHGMPAWMRQVGAWPASPLTLLAEYTIAVRTLLRGEPGPAAGRYVDVEGVVLSERPDAPPPVLLGVRGPKSLGLAGATADGVVLAEPAVPAYVAAALAQVQGGMPATDAGAAPIVVSYDVAAVHADDAAALAQVRPGLAYVGEPDWSPHLVGLPFAEELARLRLESAGPDEFAARMPDEWVAELSLAGTPAGVRERIAARHAAGASSVVLAPVGDDRLGSLDALAEVLPG
ncbi:alkanesulfonate monooxygenase SsuD/methylene tetrahydromethanopterin reductase-like flavin-dependent oxidoreductase (luciferase family) [Agromyces terreus]|uniref:Alkanesulfonate monooxygenase SsuD/methylene tetrahydromethanopterin reductase-like flavin-dependent oxidoreductase (Luciferase family) n=1 Tax=Agromyces terreus TaxID=424795 RepID=A0A9X2H5G0_9MICO|nr:LLM class flavin-dependent oxidoreductase [Agromyces terreus]MCP2369749.1 alkanesulfonate monooxygenase SsuD/methylene tetrahydromethanopterin reductase-like flavin-dependent oxidoreductase (luciferase family) [Agromyces terreus]